MLPRFLLMATFLPRRSAHGDKGVGAASQPHSTTLRPHPATSRVDPLRPCADQRIARRAQRLALPSLLTRYVHRLEVHARRDLAEDLCIAPVVLHSPTAHAQGANQRRGHDANVVPLLPRLCATFDRQHSRKG
jgi:hypothetical protein